MITLSIDPGKHHAGWAIFVERTLVRAGVVMVRPEKDTHNAYYRQGRHKQVTCASSVKIAETIGAHVEIARRIVESRKGSVHVEYVGEMMHVYVDEDGRLTERASPVELLFIQTTMGAIAGEIRQPKSTRYVEAAEWKKQRGDLATWTMIRNTLDTQETEVAKSCGVYDETGSLRKHFHHGLEAIGIGLWSLFRL